MTTTTGRRRSYSPAERERYDTDRRRQLEDAHARLTAALGSLANADQWQAWLRFAAGFHRYSFNNTLWLMLQSGGTATAVAGYKAWQAKGRQVRAGEKALKVFAPIFKRVEQADRDGRPILDAAGKPRRVDQLVGMRLASVFDVTATDGEPLPERPQARLLTGQAPEGLWDALAGMVAEQGFTLSRGDCDGANGWTRPDTRQVRVRADLDDLAATKTLIHELGHMLAGHGQNGPVDHRGIQEVEAESVAFMVLQAHGVDASQYTFNYVVGWAQTAATDEHPVEDIVRRTGERVIAIADKILARTQPTPDLAEDAIDALAAQTIPATSPAMKPQPGGTHRPAPTTTRAVDPPRPRTASTSRALPR